MVRPPIVERLRSSGPPAAPRPAAAVVIVRDGPRAPELLLVQRGPRQRVMAGAWVFPGGALDEGETAADAAVRELREEAGIEGPRAAELVLFSRWITPERLERRFDTRFYVARAPTGAQPRVDGSECVAARWASAADALAAHARDELPFAFPTLRQLEQLRSFAHVEALLAHARTLDVRPVLPRVVGDDPPRIVLPGEPGYDGADDSATLTRPSIPRRS